MAVLIPPSALRTLFSPQDIQSCVALLGKRIAAAIPQDDSVVFVSLLRGSFIFFADLIRAVQSPFALVDFMVASSYGHNARSSGSVRIIKDLDTDISGKAVILVDDVIDTGLTLHHIVSLLQTRNPRSISVCSLLDKPSRRSILVPLDYVGFVIDDVFVVGYGIDYAEQYRALPYIAAVDPSVLKGYMS